VDVIVGVSVIVAVGVTVGVGVSVMVGVAVGKAPKVAVAAYAVWVAISSAVGPQAEIIQAKITRRARRFIGILLLDNQLFN
jgi:hypothetical protein